MRALHIAGQVDGRLPELHAERRADTAAARAARVVILQAATHGGEVSPGRGTIVVRCAMRWWRSPAVGNVMRRSLTGRGAVVVLWLLCAVVHGA
eukprot:360363-Chlamydomonas_euryale.AAC.4